MGERQHARRHPAVLGPSAMRAARAAFGVGVRWGGRPVGWGRGAPLLPSAQHPRPHAATGCSGTRQTAAPAANRWPFPMAQMASRDVTWRPWPWGCACVRRRSTA